MAHCPTKEMIADHFTKPLQGALFRVLRDAVMGIEHSGGSGSVSPDPKIHWSVLGIELGNESGGTHDKGQTKSWASVVANGSS